MYFYPCKRVYAVVEEFFEICRDSSNIMCLVSSLFLIYQNDTITFTKVKSFSYSNK